MRKRLAGILTFLLCLLLCVSSALAEEVRVTVTASETELSDSGNVKFTFNISNFSDYELRDIVIVYNGTSHTELQATVVPPNQSIQNYELELPVSESQLGNPLLFTVSAVRNGEPITTEASVTIARSSDPVITVTREVQDGATMARQGDSVKLTYTLKNETKFDMTDIQLIDQEVSDTPQKLQLLRAGGTMSWDWSITMGEDDVRSAPTVTYTVGGKTKSFSGVEAVTLTALLVRLDMQVSAGTPTSAGVNFTIEVKNTGNQEIKNITISDERGNAVNSAPFSLKADESTTQSFQVVPVMTEASREVKFTLKGTDTLDKEYTLTTPESYSVYPFVDDTQINVTLKTETVTPWTSETGKIVARVLITNHSQVALTNVTVLETGNVLQTYDTLQSGETSADFEIILGSPRNLSFTVKGADPTGAMRELAVSQLPVAYGTEAADASPSPEQISAGGNMQAFSFLSSTISKILVALGILMVLSFVVLIGLSIAERNRMGGVRFDAYEDDEEDDLDDFFRESERDPPSYFDDHEAVRNYTQRIQNSGSRRTVDTTRRTPAPIPLPPSTRPVQVEYDAAPTPPVQPAQPTQPDMSYWTSNGAHSTEDDYPAPQYAQQQTRYTAQDAPVYAAPALQAPPVQTYAQPQPAGAYDAPQFAQHSRADAQNWLEADVAEEDAFPYYGSAEGEGFTVKNALQTPKVIVNKRAPAVQPQRRGEVHHVHKDTRK